MCPPTSANTVYFNDAEFDKAMDEGLHTANEEEQAEIMDRAQEIAWNDAVWLFLGNDQIVYCNKVLSVRRYVAPDGASTSECNFSTVSLKSSVYL